MNNKETELKIQEIQKLVTELNLHFSKRKLSTVHLTRFGCTWHLQMSSDITKCLSGHYTEDGLGLMRSYILGMIHAFSLEK